MPELLRTPAADFHSKDTIVIPDKLYFKIGEVARLLGVETYVLRYWETEFPQITPVKSKTNQRLYKRHDVETIVLIRDLLYQQKFTISGAKKKLKELNRDVKRHFEEQQASLDLDAAPAEDMMPQVRQELTAIVAEMDDFLKRSS